ncbi:MAG: glutaminyl-peptide cyclotransferase, partial [Pirellulaceae bacterium]
MAKQRPIRNEDLAAEKASAAEKSDTLFGGIPRERLPLIVLFFGVTIGSFLIWSVFSRPPILDYYTYELVKRYPHDATSFTQGLIHHRGELYESSGKYGRSSIRKVDLET